MSSAGVVKEFWSDGGDLYPKMVTLLDVELYRRPVLSGLILSIGSKNESTVSVAHVAISDCDRP